MAKPKSSSSPAPTKAPASPVAPQGASASPALREPKPDREAVARRAYERYCQRCESHQPGCELTDWLEAEADLSQR